MALRPARTCRDIGKVAWTRYSRKKPRKSYIKAMPHNKLTQFVMGTKGSYSSKVSLVATTGVQIRDNALEAARQAINKHLETTLPGKYYLCVRVYPHQVIRENKMVAGAGADRISKGMRRSFGRATDVAARVYENQAVFDAYVAEKDVPIVKESYKRAKVKLPGSFKIVISSLSPSSA